MIFDGWLTQPRLPQPGLKTIQDRLVRQLNRLNPLLIRLGMVGIRHATPLFPIRRSSSLSIPPSVKIGLPS